MSKKKVQNRRGSREHGRGKKKGRGAGLRGGRGNANSGGAKKVHFFKKYGHRYFGNHGFKRPLESITDIRCVNVGDLDRLVPQWSDEEGVVDASGDVMSVDLDAAGYDKLLGGGHVTKAYTVTVASATSTAVAKLEAQGGSVVESAE